MKMTYAEKLKDPRWQKKRLEVMTRSGFRCDACGRGNETLHVHHLIYPRWEQGPWEMDSAFMECLCATCHGAREEANQLNRAFFESRPTREIITEKERREYLNSLQ